MLWYPEVQVKAQEEMDQVVGKGRLPDFSDQTSLPYLSALILELLRWRIVGPMGVPHLSEAEDVYKGYRIPAGSIIIPNSW